MLNVKCKKCQRDYADGFNMCPYCCKHPELEFYEDWAGGDDDGFWTLAVRCAVCGDNFSFSNDDIISGYKAVKK